MGQSPAIFDSISAKAAYEAIVGKLYDQLPTLAKDRAGLFQKSSVGRKLSSVNPDRSI
ncbi:MULTISPECIES: hypothetical protein [Kamptonema]|uniref:hypothetical protein n=1 Tax=Kamptonema TaxID=1501433 RepID=UPI0001DAC1DB|nr:MULTISPECIES: hypothetical protein [Kamptonema]CBN58984.1 hypothetical protein OSCI_3960030 [Kamptonema sp. PCC 6506]